MVFESVVADVLNRILGNYIENLDHKQLKIGIWGGDVVLNNLKLKDNALDEVDLPVELVYGYLSELVLKIPWKNLYSQPVIAQIEGLYVIVSPKIEVRYNAEKEAKYNLQTKQEALQALEDAHKKDLEKDAMKADATFTEKLTAQIVNNLQVKISNVHLRYEDSSTTGDPFSCGVTLHDLELYTTNTNWEKTYLTENVSHVFKIAKLDSLSAYMNCRSKMYSSLKKANLADVLRENIAHENLVPGTYNYIIGPISVMSKLQLNINPEYDDPPFLIPKIDLSLDMQKVNVGLTSTQFQDIIKLFESMNRMQLGSRYRKYRPYNIPYKKHYRIWWKFAITAILEEDIKRRNREWTWKHIIEHRQRCKEYAKSFKEMLLSKKPPATLIEKCKLLEEKLDLFNLVLIRKRIHIEVDKIRKDKERRQSEKAGWFGSWFGGRQNTEAEQSSDIVSKLEAAMTVDEKAKLYEAIGYEEGKPPPDMPIYYVAIRMCFELVALEIGLYDDSQVIGTENFNIKQLKTLLLLNLSMTTCNIAQRPGSNSLSVTVGMRKIKLLGLHSESEAPTLIESETTDEFNLLDVFFEINPLDMQCDQRIQVSGRQLQIIYDADTVIRLVKIFTLPQANLSEIEVAASERMANFKERSTTGLKYMIEQKPALEIDIKLLPSILIIPSMGKYVLNSGDQSVLVITLGELHVTSKPNKMSSSMKLSHVMAHAYDEIKVSIADIQLMVVKPKEDWKNVLFSALDSDMHLLRPTSVFIIVSLCAVNDDPRLPKIKVNVEIPSVAFNVTEDRILVALHLITSIPLPKSETPEAPLLTKKTGSIASLMTLTSFFPNDKKKDKYEENIDPTTEIVQYTDIELVFSLKEFTVALNKSTPSNVLYDKSTVATPVESIQGSNAFGTPVEEIPSEEIDEGIFRDDILRGVDRPEFFIVEPILLFHVLELGVIMHQRTYELVIKANLGAVKLQRHETSETPGSELNIIDTPRSSEEVEYLLTVSYVMAQQTSPEFFTKYNATEQLITINFSTLHIILHQEVLMELMELTSSLQQKLQNFTQLDAAANEQPKDRTASVVDSNIFSKLNVIMEDDTISAKPTVRIQPHIKVVNRIQIHVKANLERVSLLLTCNSRDLAELQVDHFNANVLLKSSYTEINLNLKHILVTDLNPLSKHSRILSIVGDNVFTCQVIIFNLSETSNYNSDSMKISASIGGMKIVFLNWFLVGVLSFLNNFQEAQAAISQASAAAAESAKQNAIIAYENASRIKLDIKIKAPVIIVPMDSQSVNALVLDLGYLTLSNIVTEIKMSTEKRRAAIDEISLNFKNLKLAKAAILLDDTGRSSNDTVDMAYGIKSHMNILDPVSCKLTVKRNLSSTWYRKEPEINIFGHLDPVEINLFMEDYSVLMAILNRNLIEGTDEFPPVQHHETPNPIPTQESQPVKPEETPFTAMLAERRKILSTATDPTASSNKKVYEHMKFNFLFDGVVINFLLSDEEGLACFGLYFLSVKGNKLVTGTLNTSIVLCNIQIDDTRKSNKSPIKKYLCRKKGQENFFKRKYEEPDEVTTGCKQEKNFMLEFTASINEEDVFAEMRVCSFDLILCVEYLYKLVNFLQLPHESETLRKSSPTNFNSVGNNMNKKGVAVPVASPQPAPPVDAIDKKVDFVLHIEEPDIIVVENLADLNTNAIIFNVQAQVNYRAIGDKQIINGEIDSLKLYMCSFLPERRDSTRHYILHPCRISAQGSTPEEEGLHISLKFSEIIINVSPAAIELLNKAALSLTASKSQISLTLSTDIDYSQLWNQKDIKSKKYWFLKVDQGVDALEYIDDYFDSQLRTKKTERCIVEVPSITLVVETGLGYYTRPLISIDIRVNSVISDWSTELKIRGSLTLNTNYFNQTLAVWEPVIELNERTNRDGISKYLPWELNYKVDITNRMYNNYGEEESGEKVTNIVIQSDEDLQFTVTKTCLDLLSVLSESFSQAINIEGLAKPELIVPYVVENDTGFEIFLNFKHGIFTLHEHHMQKPNSMNRVLVFLTEHLPNQVKSCKILAGGRAYLQTKDLSTITKEQDEEYNLYVQIGGIEKEIILPVSKSDQRYFPLYSGLNQEPWGIISEVRSEYGTTIVNIHGIVKINNHFTTKIQIHRYKQGSVTMDSILVGEVDPGAVYNVPLHAIYSDNKDLHFSLEGYNISVQGIKWNDYPTDLEYSRQLQCDPINTFETFCINVRREKTEVFHENSTKYTILSAYYTLHLRPPVYLHNALPISISVSVAGCSVRYVESEKLDDRVSNVVKEDMLDYGEKEVAPGDVLHLPTIQMSGRSIENRSFLVIRLIQYLEKDWSCTTEIFRDHSEMATWLFSSYDSETKMDMHLSVRFTNREGSLQISLYSPFWMINKTGLMLSYKTDVETIHLLYHPPEYNGPILFSFREKYFFAKKAATIRVDNGDWSNKIPLDVAGSMGAVTCKSTDMKYEIGVHNHLTYNSLTKIITFLPFYIATNKCHFIIDLQEQSRPGDPWIKILPNSFMPIWPKGESDLRIVVKVYGQCAPAFKYDEAQCTLLKLPGSRYGGVNVDVHATEGGVYINFSEYNPGNAPGLIINHTSLPIVYQENDVQEDIVINPYSRLLHAWSNPSGENSLIFQSATNYDERTKNKLETDLRRDELGIFRLSNDSVAYWVSFLDGLQRVLLFTEDENIQKKIESTSTIQKYTQSITFRIHGIGVSLINNVIGVTILYMGIASSGVIWEQKKGTKKFKQMNIHETTELEEQYQKYLVNKGVDQVSKYYLDGKYEIDFEKMILKKYKVWDLCRTFYPGVWFVMNTSLSQMQLHIKINKIQIDNQLSDYIFPVVLTPIPPPRSVATTTALKPFIEVSAVQLVTPNSTVKQYKYVSMLIQEFHFKVDLMFLTALSDMFATTVTDEQATKLFNIDVESVETQLEDLVATTYAQEQKNFYDNLHLGPIKIHLSFSMAGSDTTALPAVLSTLVQGIGVTLTDVNDVVFRLGFFGRECQFFTQRELTSEIIAHYTGQALKQMYVLVFGLDVLGNPYGLVVGFKKGVEDLFYEPFQGAIQGPGEFAEGLSLGVKSLFGHTVGGAAGAASKITGAMGKGLAALTFDEDFQRRRRLHMNRKPQSFYEGVARSGKSLVMGFVDGVSGVVTKPVVGAREEGVEGFFKGLGKGAIGFVAQPTAGVVDFASGSLGAVRRVAQGHHEVSRLRAPRFVYQDHVVRPYCRADAEGNRVFREIEKGKYASTDIFVHCEELVSKHEYLVITNYRIIHAIKSDLFGTYTVQWKLHFEQFDTVKPTERGLEIIMKKQNKKVMGVFSTNEIVRKCIPMNDLKARDNLIAILEAQHKSMF